MTELRPRTVLLVEDQPSAQALLEALIRDIFGAIEIRTTATTAQAFKLLDRSWHLALIDLRLLDGSGLDVLRRFKAVHPDVPAIVTTLYSDDQSIYAALQAGADGYLLKTDPPEQLGAGLRRITRGEPPLSAAVARRVLSYFRGARGARAETGAEDGESLTPRETEVLAAIGEGLSVEEAGERLGVAPSTVRAHIKAIYRKLGIRSRAEAALAAERRGLLGPG
jgi:DNA-binding NarL/FixJ family response regulator